MDDGIADINEIRGAVVGLYAPARVLQMIPYGRQSVTDEDIQAVVKVLRSDWLTQGPEVEAFEADLAAYCGAAHAVVVSSATSALHLACLAAGLGPGDRLWTSPNTFVASANCGLYCGAKVDFVDIDPATGNLDVAKLKSKLEHARARGSLPKVVIPVHFAGQSCEMEAIRNLSRSYGFTVIEDASHAVGADYREGKVGSCVYSDMTVFSFHPVKIATTGEGGAVLTRNPALHSQIVSLRSHGITRDPSVMERPYPGPWYYEQQALGFNYRMCDLQAALGRSQLKKVDAFVARRRELAARYDRLLVGLPVKPLRQATESRSAFHLYVVRIDRKATAKSQAELLNHLRESGIAATLHYLAVHTQPFYLRQGFKAGDFPEAELHASEAVTLPLFYGLSDADQDHIVAEVRRAFGR
jgi:UDP-4-amino-4,6-dideoxy-N-acetyl-beta-L-altrosamine transaminase